MFPSDDNFETSVTLETSANIIGDEEPFHILLLGDWSGIEELNFQAENSHKFQPIEIDRDNFENVLNNFKIKLDLDLKNDLTDIVTIDIKEFNDFHPDYIFQKLPCFSELRDIRKRLLNKNTFDIAASEVRSWSDYTTVKISNPVQPESNENSSPSDNLLDQILDQTSNNISHSDKEKTQKSELDFLIGNLVKPFVNNVDEDEQLNLVEVVDKTISELMREILHHPKFQKLETAWRSLYFLVRRIETNSKLKIFIADVNKGLLSDDLKSVENLSDSAVFDLLAGKNDQNSDKNWAVVCGNYDFTLQVEDVAFLMRLAKILSVSDSPFISYVKPKSFEKFTLENNFSLNSEVFFDEIELKLWDTLRFIPESSYLGFALPQILSRLPYSPNIEPLETFAFEEFEDLSLVKSLTWSNPIFGCALLLAQSFTYYGWELTDNLQLQIEDLPFFNFQNDDENCIQNSLQFTFNQNESIKLMDLGFMIFVTFKNSDFIRLIRFQSVSNNSSQLNAKWT